MKGEIKPDHMPVNNFTLQVVGLVSLTAVEISGIEDELNVIDLPDRTVASGGTRNATEFDLSIPLHHTVEMAALELWFREAQDPISPTYKKPGTLIHHSLSDGASRSYTLVGLFPKKRKLPDLDMSNEGEMAMAVWTMAVDDVVPI